MIALGVSVTAHLIAVAVLVAVAATPAVRGFLAGRAAREEKASARNPLKAWTEPRTLLIGVFVFAMAFTEGTGNDWLGVATIDGYGAAAALGSLTFAVFLAAMTLGRWFGPALLDRYGRVPMIRVIALTALARPGARRLRRFAGRRDGRRDALGAGHRARVPGRDERREPTIRATPRAASASCRRWATSRSWPGRR